MKLNLYSLILLVILNLISLVLFFHLGIKGIQKMYDAIDYINKDTIQEYNKSKDSLQQGNGIIYENDIDINPKEQLNTLQRGTVGDRELALSQINNLEKKMNVKRNIEELALTNQDNIWKNALKESGITEDQFYTRIYMKGYNPDVAFDIIKGNNIEKYKETNPEFFKEVTKNGKTEIVLDDKWQKNRDFFQTAKKKFDTDTLQDSMSTIYNASSKENKNAIVTAINSKENNNAMASSVLQMDRMFRSSPDDRGFIKNMITAYPEEGLEFITKLITQEPTTNNLKSLVTKHQEMIQRVTGLSGTDFIQYVNNFRSKALDGLKTRGSGFKNQSNMLTIGGKKNKDGNYEDLPIPLQLYTGWNDLEKSKEEYMQEWKSDASRLALYKDRYDRAMKDKSNAAKLLSDLFSSLKYEQ